VLVEDMRILECNQAIHGSGSSNQQALSVLPEDVGLELGFAPPVCLPEGQIVESVLLNIFPPSTERTLGESSS